MNHVPKLLTEADDTEMSFFRSPSGSSESDPDSGHYHLGNQHQTQALQALTKRDVVAEAQRAEQRIKENKHKFEGYKMCVAGQMKELISDKENICRVEFELKAGSHQLIFCSPDGGKTPIVSSHDIHLNGVIELKLKGEWSEGDNQFQLAEPGTYEFKILTDWQSFSLIMTKLTS
ncbi:hypothetical protein [Parashewanella curva]|nr:hypothetical protein [Parashewanella curva]